MQSINTQFSENFLKGYINTQNINATQDSKDIKSFSSFLKDSISKLNEIQIQADSKVTKMIAEPSKVDLHEVMGMVNQAELSLLLAKSITERVIRSYNDMVNLR